MANAAAHREMGAYAGFALGLVRAQSQPLGAVPWELLGATIGGTMGAALPDVVDPPSTPDHRHVGHGALNCYFATAWGWSSVTAFQEACRASADALAAERVDLADNLVVAMSILAECMLRVTGGIAVGMVAGYVSHLAIDAMTPRGLPLVVREC